MTGVHVSCPAPACACCCPSTGRSSAATADESCWSACRTRSSDTMSMTGFLDFFTAPRHARGRAGGAERPASHGSNDASNGSDRRSTRPTTIAGYQLRVGRAVPLRRDARAGRRQFLGLLQPRDLLHAGALRQGRAAADGRDPVPGRVPHRQRLRHDRLRPRLREHRVRLPHGRAAGTRRTGHRFDRPKILLDPLRQGDRRPRRLGRDAGLERRLSSTAAGWCSTTSTGRTTGRWRSPIEDLVIYEMHVRGFTRASVVGRQVSRHLRRPPREDPLPEGAGRQLPRADADLRVRRVREQPAAPGRRASCC